MPENIHLLPHPHFQKKFMRVVPLFSVCPLDQPAKLCTCAITTKSTVYADETTSNDGKKKEKSLEVPARSDIPLARNRDLLAGIRHIVDLAHRLVGAIAVGLAVAAMVAHFAGLGVDRATSDRRPVDVVGSHLDGGEAVVLAVNCWQEVHDEGGDIKDVDEGDCPFEDGGSVVLFLVGEDTKG